MAARCFYSVQQCHLHVLCCSVGIILRRHIYFGNSVTLSSVKAFNKISLKINKRRSLSLVINLQLSFIRFITCLSLPYYQHRQALKAYSVLFQRDRYISEVDMRSLRRQDSLATLDNAGTREDSARHDKATKTHISKLCLGLRALTFVSCSVSLYLHMAHIWLHILTDTQQSC